MKEEGNSNVIKVALAGIGGFGKIHAEQIANLSKEGILACVAFTEIRPELNKITFDLLQGIGAQHYFDYEEMLMSVSELDVVVIATPISFHQSMCNRAMERGFHVLLEKPPTATIQDLDDMLTVQKKFGKLAAVNFQNTSGKAFRYLLSIIEQGIIGDVQTIVAVGNWKRTQAYYDRNLWAGKISLQGKFVLDGSIHNALAHLLQNSLIIAGGGNPERAWPLSVQAELYKGHSIESEDTACIRVCTIAGPTVYYYSTLCNETNDIPYIRVLGSNGELRWSYLNDVVHFDSSGVFEQRFNFGEEDNLRNIYLNLMESVSGKRQELYCSLAACRSFLAAANNAFLSSGQVTTIPVSFLNKGEDVGAETIFVNGIGTIIEEAQRKQLLFSEFGVPWAVASAPIDTSNYKWFEWPK